jgi:hypothetical protein
MHSVQFNDTGYKGVESIIPTSIAAIQEGRSGPGWVIDRGVPETATVTDEPAVHRIVATRHGLQQFR